MFKIFFNSGIWRLDTCPQQKPYLGRTAIEIAPNKTQNTTVCSHSCSMYYACLRIHKTLSPTGLAHIHSTLYLPCLIEIHKYLIPNMNCSHSCSMCSCLIGGSDLLFVKFLLSLYFPFLFRLPSPLLRWTMIRILL